MRSAIRKIFVPREKILCWPCKIFPFARLMYRNLKTGARGIALAAVSDRYNKIGTRYVYIIEGEPFK